MGTKDTISLCIPPKLGKEVTSCSLPPRNNSFYEGEKKYKKSLALIIAQHFMFNSEKRGRCLKPSWSCLEQDVSPVVVKYRGEVAI